MRRLPTLLCGVLALGVVQVAAPPATAGPAPELCTLDPARGGVPAGFVLDACADAGALTLRNGLDVPVVVAGQGDVAAPLTVHADHSTAAEVLQFMVGADTLLMPGDVVRWPLGTDAAELVVGPLPGPAVPAILDSLGSLVPGPADESADDLYAAFAQVIAEVAAGVGERADCVAGKNFLRVAACDVVTSVAIGRAVFMHLPRRTARSMHALLGDPRSWADWDASATADAAVVEGRGLHLVQAPVPPPAPAPTVAPPVSPSPAAPAPSPPAPPPAPSPVPVPASAAPVPGPPFGERPARDPHGTRSEIEQWLRQAYERALAERAQQAAGNGHGKGHGNGHGNGNGHGG